MPDEQKTILVVEDEATLYKAIKSGLEREGFVVFVATDGIEGLELAKSEKPDLILLDILLPKKTGLEMLKELRATKHGKLIPVIMLTNVNETKDINTALEFGAYDYLIKADWSLADVIDRIHKRLV